MKRIFIAIFFITLSVLIGIFGLFETERICNKMIIEIEQATEENKKVTEDNSHQGRLNFYDTANELNARWEENSDFFYFFFNNDDIKNIETNIEKLPTHAKNGDFESAYLCLVECLEDLEYVKNSVSPSFNNIF